MHLFLLRFTIMDFPQFQIARPEFKDFRRPNYSQHAHVEVALIDRSQHGVFHHVFQLNNSAIINIDQIDRLKQEIANLDRDAFTFIGEAIQVDMDKKMILLSGNNTITFRYLIVVSSPFHAGEFNAFLTALKDSLLLEALNARAKIGESKKQTQQGFSAIEDSSPNKVSPVVQKRMAQVDLPDASANHAVNPKHICQVKT